MSLTALASAGRDWTTNDASADGGRLRSLESSSERCREARHQPASDCDPFDARLSSRCQLKTSSTFERIENLSMTSGGCQDARPGRRRRSRVPLSGRYLWLGLLALGLLVGATSGQQLAPTRRGRQAGEDDSAAAAAAAAAAATTTTAAPETSTTRSGEDEGAATTTTTPAPTTTTEEVAATTTTPSTTTTTSTTTPAPTTPRAKPKIPPVNYTRVDELFEGVASEADVAAKWRKLDKTLQAGVGSALKVIFPHIVSMASDAKVSGDCSGAILKWIINLKNMRTWAVQMLDAIGKPSAGLLEGSLTLFGNYKQCLGVRAPDEDEIELADGEFKEYFRGQYCVLQVRPPLTQKPRFYSLNSTIASLLRKSYKYYEKNAYDDLSELAMAFNFVSVRADLCVPSRCSRDDIQRVADFLMAKVDMRARVLRCEIQPVSAAEAPSVPESHASAYAAASGASLDITHLLWSALFVVVLLLVLVSTLTSMLFKMKKRTSKSKTRSLFTSMSVYRSLSHMRNVQLDRISDQKPVVLYALRIFILTWIFLVNLTSQLNFQYLRELLALRDLIMLWPMQLIVNSSLAYDSLILLTAFTYSYQNINSNLSDLIKYNASKYTRLMPSIMLFVALTIVTPLLYPWRSPVWHDFVDEPARVCKSTGFLNLFFLQNLLSSNQICLPQTWIFCVELQLCLLALPLVYMMNKKFDSQHGLFRLGSAPILMTLLLALLGCALNFRNVFTHQLPAAWFQTYPDKDDKHAYFTQHLYKTSTHLTTFAVGLFAGHLCRCQAIETFSGRPYGRRCCDTLMWLTSGLVMLALIFCTHSWSLSGTSHLESPLLSATYGALAPLLWSVSLSMILFQLTVPDELNQRSSLAALLTSDVNLVRLGRLSFLAYLINPYVNSLIYAVQEQAIFSSIIMLAHTFIGNLVITFALAFVVSALVELPCRRLFKKLLIGSRRQSSNLDIITRQLDIRHHAANAPPPRSPFSTANASAAAAAQKQAYAASKRQQQLNQMHQAAMIPLK